MNISNITNQIVLQLINVITLMTNTFKGIYTEHDNRQIVIYARVSTRILQVFSCRLYGLRKYKKQIEGDGEIAKELQDGNKSNRGAKG